MQLISVAGNIYIFNNNFININIFNKIFKIKGHTASGFKSALQIKTSAIKISAVIYLHVKTAAQSGKGTLTVNVNLFTEVRFKIQGGSNSVDFSRPETVL